MIRADISPENFSAALEETMNKVRRLTEICKPIRMAVANHHQRRAKQVDLGEKPIDQVPLANPITILKELELQLTLTRAALETVNCKNQQLGGSNMYLVPKSKDENGVQ